MPIFRRADAGTESDDKALLGLSPIDIFDAVHDGIVVIDAEGVIVYVNNAYSNLMNVPAERALGSKMAEITPNARMLSVLATGEEISGEAHFSEELGFDVVLSATPIFRNGRIAGVVTVFRGAQDLLDLYAAYRRTRGLVDYYRNQLESSQIRVEGFDSVVGQNAALRRILDMANRAAKTDATILITGENGVGKDVLANAIHKASQRMDKAFIAVNCAAIPDALLESELFGFEGGSFTGAARGGKLGKFDLAHRGTIFLDEVGDMSTSMQAKLLRVLQDGAIERIGGSRATFVDVRLIAATNQDLSRMVKEGRFREDLYYRLNVFPIVIPPLRERRDDVPILARHLLEQLCRTYKREITISPEVFEILRHYDWPGNVRQLRNAIERAIILCPTKILLPEHFDSILTLPSYQDRVEPPVAGLRADVKRVERHAYEEALAKSEGNRSRAMRYLGVSRRTFYKRLGEFGLMHKEESAVR